MSVAALLFLFQVATGDPATVPAPAAPESAAPAAEPKVVCRMENVTGSRARKQKVCKTQAYNEAGEAQKRAFQDFQSKASAGGPMGVKPGGG
jgi:hypothetical protein